MKQNSKFLSLVLRHKPEVIGITLDPQGWVSVDTLLGQAAKQGQVAVAERKVATFKNRRHSKHRIYGKPEDGRDNKSASYQDRQAKFCEAPQRRARSRCFGSPH